MTPAPATPARPVAPGSVVVPLPPEFFAHAQAELPHSWGPLAAPPDTPPFQAPPFSDMSPPGPLFIGAPPVASPPILEGVYPYEEWDGEAEEDVIRMPNLSGLSERDAVTMGLQIMKESNANALMSSPEFLKVANAVTTGQMTLDEALPLMLSLAAGQNGATS